MAPDKGSAGRERRWATRARSVRVSVSLPPEIYSTLQDIAKQKKVSVAWVIRDAAEMGDGGEAGHVIRLDVADIAADERECIQRTELALLEEVAVEPDHIVPLRAQHP